ncbi:MAG: glycosyltransferase family 2 protein [Candidatus Promineifilaceae bacterium]
MPAAVLDVNICDLPEMLDGLEGYDQAFVLLRAGLRPAARLWLPVEEGRVPGTLIQNLAEENITPDVWQQIIAEEIASRSQQEKSPPAAAVTVAVITRERPDDLRRCLEALLAQPDDGQEILVVDSAPETNRTQRLAASYGERIRYLRVERRGASTARNSALAAAKGDIVLFTDDDAFPEPGWQRALLRHFEDPLVLCATGLVLPYELETDAQYWFERYCPHGRGFLRVVFDAVDHDPLAVAAAGVSASMALRKSTLDIIGGFEEALSPGTPTYSGEDAEIYSRILCAGYRIVYDPAAVSWHRHRRSWPELRSALFGYGTGVYAQWMHTLFMQREAGILRLPPSWLLQTQLPNLVRSLFRREGSYPLDLLLAELLGCANGPFAYLTSRRRLSEG